MSSNKKIDNNEELPIQKLLSCFFSECERQFRFLEMKHGFSYYSGLVNYRGGRQVITPYSGQNINENFFAVTRYEKNNQSFEISFSTPHFTLESHICYDRVNRFGFEEILQALKMKDRKNISANWVQKEEDIIGVISESSKFFHQNSLGLLIPQQKIIDKAISIHSKALKRKVMEEHKQNIKEISLRAAKAFCDKDYRRVIEVLMPYKADLGAADKKKLTISQKLIAPLKPSC